MLGWVLLMAAMVGEAASLTLSVERFRLAADPGYLPSCDLNPVLSCGSIMSTPQASAFGFPNPLLGVAGFAVVATAGAALLAGARLADWFWVGLQLGAVGGLVFVHWLIVQSLYVIGALCPYCMVVWVCTVVIFWYVTLESLRRWTTPGRSGAVGVLQRYHVLPVVGWVAVIVVLIAIRFWDYWRTLL
jgi:uncharacterized membrane protein